MTLTMQRKSVDKNLLNRLEKLEQGIDIGDPRTASLDALEAYVSELFGHRPSTKELEQYVAEQKAAKEPKQ